MAKIDRKTDGKRSAKERIEENGPAAHHYIRSKQNGFSAFGADEAYYKLEKCRYMLLIGLASHGGIERLLDAQGRGEREIPKKNLPVIDPSESCTTGDFAEALRFVDILMLEIRDHTEQEAAKEAQS